MKNLRSMNDYICRSARTLTWIGVASAFCSLNVAAQNTGALGSTQTPLFSSGTQTLSTGQKSPISDNDAAFIMEQTNAPDALQIRSSTLNAQESAKDKRDNQTKFVEPKRQAAEKSKFQEFVQQSSGKLLPIYGEALFAQPQAYQVDASAPVAADHLIGPGDEIEVQLWGGVNYQGKLLVDRNGQVTIPSIGVVDVAGVSAGQVGSVLRSQVAKTYSNFEMNANLGRLRGIPVYVVGAAKQPGSYTLPSTSTLVNALFASGGPSAQGSMRKVQLKRKGQVISTIDLYDFISKGDKSQDVALQAGDVIVIQPAGPRVAVLGVLDQEAIYELKSDGESTVGELLQLTGGASILADTKKALIERIDQRSESKRMVEEVPLDQAGLSRNLQDGDVLTLLGISPAFANAVTLQGNVASPLRYRWFEGMRVRDLIPEAKALITTDYYQRKNALVQNISIVSEIAGQALDTRVRNMVDEINWDYAVIERLDPKQLRTEIIPFNLGLAVIHGDESQNLELKEGDVVTVLSQKDLKIPVERQTRLVRVEGEVASPGLYQVKPGETLDQLLMRIGGVTPQAYIFGTAVQRNSVRERQQENLNLLIQRLETQQQSQMLHMLANRSSADMASQAMIMQQQEKLAQNQIAALRKLRSNGRVTLELDPQKASLSTLPELILEDGDHILVPPTPGFISVAGAVNNENVFIYKPGRTVSDVIKVAGLREEADNKQMFVLRADGSIVANNNVGIFGRFSSLELMPGDTVMVPEKLDRETTRNFVVRQLKDMTQILSQFGLGVAAIKVIRDL